jgi:hypothetical protein
MTKNERQIIDELANALQAAAPLATTIGRTVGTAAQCAIDLEAAVARAVSALDRLKPQRSRSDE